MLVMFPRSTWCMPYFVTVLLSSGVVLAFLGYIFGVFESNVKGDAPESSETRTIPTYLALFIFAELYQCLLTFDALRHKNTIQVIGLNLFSLAMLVYASIQYDQIYRAITNLTTHKYYNSQSWMIMKAFIIAIPCVIGLALLLMSVFTYKLYGEFGWSIYKHVGADIRLKRRYVAYLIFITLVKIDFFFFLGFTIQFIVIVLDTKDVEFALTIAVIPVTILILWLALVFVKRESYVGMISMIAVFFTAMAYFFFKLVRMYQPDQEDKYMATRKTLTTFAVITILLLLVTIINAVICTVNFGYGLKQLVINSADDDEDKYPLDSMDSLGGPKSGMRMTID